MDSIKEQLLKEAILLHGKIEPPHSCGSLAECFTTEESRLIFWFNDQAGNTRVLIKEREPNEPGRTSV